MNRVVLAGLTPRPLATYLAATGLLRTLAEQKDPPVRAAWESDGFVLYTRLNRIELSDFLLDDYAPTCLVAPWNDSDQGGFQLGAAGKSAQLLEAISATSVDRLAEYRGVIETTRGIVSSRAWQRLIESKDSKDQQVMQLRNRLPDSVVRFIDAAVALTSDRATYPPLLGTGANIGRLNLVTNYLEHIMRLTDGNGRGSAEKWLAELLDGTQTRGVKGSPGQFDGHGVAAMNMVRVGKATERTNPWTFVLSMEGAISFTATATVRLGSSQRVASAPYVVAATSAGYGSAVPGENGKGEFWAPIWSGQASWSEMNAVIAEGRAIWKGRQASSGLDLMRAARTRGVDGGVSRFERYVLVERNGQSPIAVHVGTVSVGDDPAVALSGDLDTWRWKLGNTAETTAPAKIRSLRRRLDSALFDVADHPDAERSRRLLSMVWMAESVSARSGSFYRSARPDAVPPLPARWVPLLDDGSMEFAVASRLAAGWETDPKVRHRCLADLLRPIRRDEFGKLTLRQGGPDIPGLFERPLYDVLADVAVRRAITGPAPPDSGASAVRGRWIQFPIAQTGATLARRDWVEAFAAGVLDDHLLAEHLASCLLVDPRALGAYQPTAKPRRPIAPSSVWRTLAPWFSRQWIRRTAIGDGSQPAATAESVAPHGTFVPAVPPSWPTKLRNARPGQSPAVLREVASAYRAAGVDVAGSLHHVALPVDSSAGRTVLSALLVPTRVGDLRRLLDPNTERTPKGDLS